MSSSPLIFSTYVPVMHTDSNNNIKVIVQQGNAQAKEPIESMKLEAIKEFDSSDFAEIGQAALRTLTIPGYDESYDVALIDPQIKTKWFKSYMATNPSTSRQERRKLERTLEKRENKENKKQNNSNTNPSVIMKDIASSLFEKSFNAPPDTPESVEYIKLKQTHYYIKFYFKNVPSNAVVHLSPQHRLLRVHGVFFRLSGWVLPLEWRDKTNQLYYGVQRQSCYSTVQKLGLVIYLPKAVPSHWSEAFIGSHYREKEKPLYIVLIICPQNKDEEKRMLKYAENLSKQVQKLLGEHNKAIYAALKIINNKEEYTSFVQGPSLPCDVLIFLGHGSDNDGGQHFFVGSDHLTCTDILPLIYKLNSFQDPNLDASRFNLNAIWCNRGLRLVFFLSCFNGETNGIVEQISKQYPVPLLAFKKPISLDDFNNPFGYSATFCVVLFGAMAGVDDILKHTIAAKEGLGHPNLIVAIDYLSRMCFTEFKSREPDASIFFEIFVKAANKVRGATGGPAIGYEPQVFNPMGFNSPNWLTYQHIKDIGSENLSKLLKTHNLHSFWLGVDNLRKRPSDAIKPHGYLSRSVITDYSNNTSAFDVVVPIKGSVFSPSNDNNKIDVTPTLPTLPAVVPEVSINQTHVDQFDRSAEIEYASYCILSYFDRLDHNKTFKQRYDSESPALFALESLSITLYKLARILVSQTSKYKPVWQNHLIKLPKDEVIALLGYDIDEPDFYDETKHIYNSDKVKSSLLALHSMGILLQDLAGFFAYEEEELDNKVIIETNNNWNHTNCTDSDIDSTIEDPTFCSELVWQCGSIGIHTSIQQCADRSKEWKSEHVLNHWVVRLQLGNSRVVAFSNPEHTIRIVPFLSATHTDYQRYIDGKEGSFAALVNAVNKSNKKAKRNGKPATTIFEYYRQINGNLVDVTRLVAGDAGYYNLPNDLVLDTKTNNLKSSYEPPPQPAAQILNNNNTQNNSTSNGTKIYCKCGPQLLDKTCPDCNLLNPNLRNGACNTNNNSIVDAFKDSDNLSEAKHNETYDPDGDFL